MAKKKKKWIAYIKQIIKLSKRYALFKLNLNK
jgi:hypothetical protein